MAEQVRAQRRPGHLLLATDLSSRCDRALDRAARLARDWGARLTAVHVLEPALQLLEDLLPEEERATPGRREALALARLKRDLSGQPAAVEARVEEGDPARVVAELASRMGCDLVITGVARDEALGRMLLGSTVHRLARSSPVPLLVVRNRDRPYSEALVATDFSAGSAAGLATAAGWFEQLPLTLFHAYEVPFAGLLDRADVRERFQAAEQEAISEFLAAAPLTPERRAAVRLAVQAGRPEAALRRHVEALDCPLVVVGSRGRGALAETLLGSTARRILTEVQADILLVRPPAAGAAA